jgi:hypothetical protein
MKLRCIPDWVKTAFKVTFYVYLFTIATPLLAHGICFGISTMELFSLTPLMAFSVFYGLCKFKKTIAESWRRLYDHERFLLQPFFRTKNLTSEFFVCLFKLLAFFSACFLVRKRRLVTRIGLFPFFLAINHFFLSRLCE